MTPRSIPSQVCSTVPEMVSLARGRSQLASDSGSRLFLPFSFFFFSFISILWFISIPLFCCDFASVLFSLLFSLSCDFFPYPHSSSFVMILLYFFLFPFSLFIQFSHFRFSDILFQFLFPLTIIQLLRS